jgi:flagellar motor switch protein FliM
MMDGTTPIDPEQAQPIEPELIDEPEEALPQPQVEAAEAQPQVEPAEFASASPGARSFVFGSEAMRPMSALPALDRMSERLTRRLREAVFNLARRKPRIEAEPVRIERFEAWRSGRPEFTSLSLYRFRPLKGGLLIAVEPELVGRLVDAFYGGTGASSPQRTKEFTPTEERLLVRLTEHLVAILTDVWAEVVPIQLQLSARETNIAYATLVRGEEPVVITSFSVAFGADEIPSNIQIIYPCSSLRAVEAELSSKVHDEGGVAGAEWHARMAAALGNVRVDARSVLARPTLSMLELLRLAPGDVIPISRPALVPLLVGGRTIAVGTIGEHDGKAALKIEKIERDDNRSSS